MKDKIYGAIFGHTIGDALGVPVEFESRSELESNPVRGMRGYGTYNQPPGTWSDDSSLSLCLLESIAEGLDYGNLANKFLSWFLKGEYTPHGVMFDIGITTRNALERIREGRNPIEAGGMEESENGNGSLMRILPLFLYLEVNSLTREKEIELIFDLSSFTHGHIYSKLSCLVYLDLARLLFHGHTPMEAIHRLRKGSKEYESLLSSKEYNRDWKSILDFSFLNSDISSIESSGFVLHSLKASIYCLIHTHTFKTCILQAVNLGSDTDTTGAITGGLAGIVYGYNSIPLEWRNALASPEKIEKPLREIIEKYYA